MAFCPLFLVALCILQFLFQGITTCLMTEHVPPPCSNKAQALLFLCLAMTLYGVLCLACKKAALEILRKENWGGVFSRCGFSRIKVPSPLIISPLGTFSSYLATAAPTEGSHH